MKNWRTWAIVLLVPLVMVLSVVVVVQALMLRSRGWGVPMGNVAEWVAAFGTLVAIVAVLFAALGYRHDVRSRIEDEKQRIATARRQQAELLSGWFVHFGSTRYGPKIGDAPPELINVTQVGLINASQVVIYDLFVVAQCQHKPYPTPIAVGFDEKTDVVRRPDGGIESIAVQMGTIEPVAWERCRDSLAAGWAKVIAPGRWSVELRLATASVTPNKLHLFFRDHQGVHWWRDATGNLTELPVPADAQNRQARLPQIEEVLGE